MSSSSPAARSGGGSHRPPYPERPERRLSKETWKKLRAPFDEKEEVVVAAVSPHTREGEGIFEAFPYPGALRNRLDALVGPEGYSYWFEPASSSSKIVVICHLQIGHAVRSGFGSRSTFELAARVALVQAAKGFGIGWQMDAYGCFTGTREYDRVGPWPDPEDLRCEGIEPPPIGPDDDPYAGDSH